MSSIKHNSKPTRRVGMRARLRGFSRNKDGATAVEFALLAMPFFVLLFGIVEISIVFFVGSNLQNATFEASREIRVGKFSGNENQFKNIICKEMNPGKANNALATCRQRLKIKVKTLADFSEVTAFAPPAPPDDPNNPPPNYVASSGGDTVIVTATYRFPLTLPGKISGLSNVGSENSRDIKAVTAFRNEPF